MLRKPRDWHEITPQLLTAGQPTLDELKSMKVIGVETVINLALDTSDQALADERAAVEAAGMKYVHIPVIWDAPTPEDFERFCAAMDAAKDQTVFVHCVANKRVSAFLFLYRTLKLGVSRETAETDLRRLWTPDAVWQDFIDRQTNQYALGE